MLNECLLVYKAKSTSQILLNDLKLPLLGLSKSTSNWPLKMSWIMTWVVKTTQTAVKINSNSYQSLVEFWEEKLHSTSMIAGCCLTQHVVFYGFTDRIWETVALTDIVPKGEVMAKWSTQWQSMFLLLRASLQMQDASFSFFSVT